MTQVRVGKYSPRVPNSALKTSFVHPEISGVLGQFPGGLGHPIVPPTQMSIRVSLLDSALWVCVSATRVSENEHRLSEGEAQNELYGRK
jgi:hypothetical protein